MGHQEQGTNYWKSLRELHDAGSLDEQKANEFMAGVTDDFDPSQMSTMSRKQFLALLSASAAFAAAGCSEYQDKGEIVPYDRQPEGVVAGVPEYYASTCTGCALSCGILIKTREGRPIKVDGNPDHPVNRGKICAKGQASVLQLYDPYRLRAPVHGSKSGRGGDLTWTAADREILDQLQRSVAEGKEIALVLKAVVSPTLASVLREFERRFPTTRIYSYELFHDENRRSAWQACYGSGEPPVIEWQKAKVVLALEADFLGTDGNPVEQTRKYVQTRDVNRTSAYSRLYSVEGNLSLTGVHADYRLRLRPDEQLEFVLSLLSEISTIRGVVATDRRLARLLDGKSLTRFATAHGFSTTTVNHLVNDLVQHRGEGMVYAGGGLASEVHVAVNYLNEILGNAKLYDATQNVVRIRPLSSRQEIEQLIDRMKQGNVGAVIHAEANPVYQLPRSMGYREALKEVPVRVSLVESEDETAELCTHVLPIHDQLESWGDFKSRTGFLSLRQPVISPLYDTRQLEGALLAWARGEGSYSEALYLGYLKDRWQKEVFPTVDRKVEFPSFWYSALHDGVVIYRERVSSLPEFKIGAVASLSIPAAASGTVVALTENYFIGDGTFANNGWLQDLPHPVSKVVWDNYAALSVRTADALGVQDNDLIEVTLPQGSVKLPVVRQPGMADDFVAVELGYGRWTAGPVGSGAGTDATPLLDSEHFFGARVIGGAKIAKTSGHYDVVTTQEHHSLDDAFVKDLHRKRKIIQEGTLLQYLKDPKFLKEGEGDRGLKSITAPIEYTGVKWAMTIDLNKCTGCNACVAACDVENNIPVVGKEQAKMGREMQWIRIDRYYSGTSDEPLTSHQPMLCQQCDNAPCEKVCPTSATNHSPDGLNQMVYNRCVGTKYCSNNCPYKVRRFNFYDWRERLADGYYEQESVQLVHNPEVTVRSRGVMEKCTFCVQRIMAARQHAVQEGRELKGSDVKTACQVACPAEAIVFGDMNDPDSEVSRNRKHDLGYHVLEDLLVKPNVTYIARLRNTHSEEIG